MLHQQEPPQPARHLAPQRLGAVVKQRPLKDWSREEVRRALAGDPELAPAFARGLLDRTRKEVNFTLRSLNRCTEQQREDLVQASVLYMYDDGGRVLRSWEPTAGMNLASFVGLVVRRRVARVLRRGRTLPAAETCAMAASERTLAAIPAASDAVEDAIANARNLAAVRRCVEFGALSERDQRLYRAFYIEERSTSDICAAERLSSDGLHQALNRLRDRIKQCLVAGEMHGLSDG